MADRRLAQLAQLRQCLGAAKDPVAEIKNLAAQETGLWRKMICANATEAADILFKATCQSQMDVGTYMLEPTGCVKFAAALQAGRSVKKALEMAGHPEKGSVVWNCCKALGEIFQAERNIRWRALKRKPSFRVLEALAIYDRFKGQNQVAIAARTNETEVVNVSGALAMFNDWSEAEGWCWKLTDFGRAIYAALVHSANCCADETVPLPTPPDTHAA